MSVMLFIDLDETLVRTRLRDSIRPRDLFSADQEPDFSVRVGGGVYDVFVREDAYRLWWANMPFVIFSAGDRDYVKAIAIKLRDKTKLNVRGWLHRYNMADVSDNTPITEEPSVLIDERHISDRIVRYKIAKLPNGVHLRVDPWDADRDGNLGFLRKPMSRKLRRVLEDARDILGIDRLRFPKMPKASLSRPFEEHPEQLGLDLREP